MLFETASPNTSTQAYKSKAPKPVQWLARFRSDRHTLDRIADDDGVTVAQVRAGIDRAARAEGTTFAAIEAWLKPRSYVVVARERRTCEDHGPYEAEQWDIQPKPPNYTGSTWSYLDPWWSSCPTCDAEAQRLAEARNDEVARERLHRARLAETGIPARFQDSTLWNWRHTIDAQRRVWEWARDYAQTFDIALQTGRGGAFCGPPGTGKTHLGMALLRHVIEKGGTGLYCTVMGMLGRIRSTYNREADKTEQQAIDAHVRPDLLVVDEVGRSLDTNYEVAQFFRVLDLRYQQMKPTILVSNLPGAKLREFLGDAVTDRLREHGGAMLTFDWASARSPRKEGGQ